jgi:hypothetical protein
MRGTSGESPWAAQAAGRPRGRRTRPTVIAAAAALLAVIGVAGCAGHAPAAPPGGAASPPAASSPAAISAGHSSAAAPAALSWSAARAPLPAAASGLSDQYTTLVDVSCPDVGDCVAVGSARMSGASGEIFQGLVETLSDGAWTPTAIPDVSASGKNGFVSLSAVSCPARGSCVAVGFVNSAHGSLPVIEALSGGHWVPVKPSLPGDADPTTASAVLNDVTCPAAGNCLATGWYGTEVGLRYPYVDTLANDTWTAASVPLPGDAAPEYSSLTPVTLLGAAACPRAGSCTATGQYRDRSGQVRPFIDTLAGGTWTTASATLPADAAATGQNAALWTIACPAPGACIAGGHYMAGGQPRYLVETQSGGAWTASAMPLPADAAADQKWSQYAETTIIGLACESADACVATAGYVTKANEALPVIETLSGGTWTTARAPLPADAAPGTGQANATILLLATCPAAGHCLTVGDYPAADGTLEGLIETAGPR